MPQRVRSKRRVTGCSWSTGNDHLQSADALYPVTGIIEYKALWFSFACVLRVGSPSLSLQRAARSLCASTIVRCTSVVHTGDTYYRSEKTIKRSDRLPFCFCQVSLKDVARATAEVLSHLLARAGSGKIETETEVWAESTGTQRKRAPLPCLLLRNPTDGTNTNMPRDSPPSLRSSRGRGHPKAITKRIAVVNPPHPSPPPQPHSILLVHGKMHVLYEDLSDIPFLFFDINQTTVE